MKIGWIRYPQKLYEDGRVARGGSEIANQYIIDYLKSKNNEVIEFSPEDTRRIDLIDLPALGTPLMFQDLIKKIDDLNRCDVVITTNWFGAVLPEIERPLVTIFHHNANWVADSVKDEHITDPDILRKWLKEAEKYQIGKKTHQGDHEKVISLGERYFIKHSDHIISVSKTLEKTLIDYYEADKNKISVIYNSMPNQWFESVPTKVFEKGKLKLINVTRLPEDFNGFVVKGVDRILEVFSQSSLDRIWIAAGKIEKYQSLIKDKIANIRLIANAPRDQVGSELTKSNIFFHGARCESFGLGVTEAMAMENVPVAFPTGVVEEIIVNGKNGFIVQTVNEALKIIEDLNQNPEKAAQIAAEAKKTVTAQLSIEVIGKQYFDLLSKVVNEAKS